MSYISAEEVLPLELIETIQQYVNGKAIYIPSIKKDPWGSQTDTKQFLKERNQQIYEKYLAGASIEKLADNFALSVKSIQRIIREAKKQLAQ